MPGFHHSVAFLPLPFRRSAVVKFRCSVKKLHMKIPFRYSRKQQKDTQRQLQRQRQRCTETATANGNGETATEERQRMVETGHYSKNKAAPFYGTTAV